MLFVPWCLPFSNMTAKTSGQSRPPDQACKKKSPQKYVNDNKKQWLTVRIIPEAYLKICIYWVCVLGRGKNWCGYKMWKRRFTFKIVIRAPFTIPISSAKRQLVHMNTLGIGSMQHSRLTCYCRWQANALTSTVCVVTSVRWSWSRIQSLPAGTRCSKWALWM